jgi:hypothetical protein
VTPLPQRTYKYVVARVRKGVLDGYGKKREELVWKKKKWKWWKE